MQPLFSASGAHDEGKNAFKGAIIRQSADTERKRLWACGVFNVHIGRHIYVRGHFHHTNRHAKAIQVTSPRL